MARKQPSNRQPRRLQRFADPSAEVVWAGAMALDGALQHQLLRELATEIATRPAEVPRSTLSRIRVAIAALWEVYDLLGHSPSVREYKDLRDGFPELELPARTSPSGLAVARTRLCGAACFQLSPTETSPTRRWSIRSPEKS